jgi:hypothetical protein
VSDDVLQNVETIANISGDQLSISFRKNISGIHQRLGEVALKRDEDLEVDVTGWVSTAVERAASLEGKVSSLDRSLRQQEEVIRKLNQQLDDLVKAKREHEDALLGKFKELLNAKKLKIRDQQRLLATARVDSSTGNL